MKLFFLIMLTFAISPEKAISSDTDQVQCSPEQVTQTLNKYMNVLASTGVVSLKNQAFEISTNTAFGPSIYNYKWISKVDNVEVLQMCVSCYYNRISEDKAYIDMTYPYSAEETNCFKQ